MKFVLLLATVLVLVLVLQPSPALTFSSGAPTAHTGAPGENDCTACHSTFPVNTGGGSVTISAPDTYSPGQSIMIQVSVSNPTGMNQQGFEVAVKNAGGSDIGTFQVVDGGATQFAGGNTNYVTHTFGGLGQTSWMVGWTAPNSLVGPVTIYAAGLGANGDFGSSGDRVYTTSATLEEPNAPPTVANPIADQELEVGGSFFVIDLNTVFSDDDPLSFSAGVSSEGIVSADVSGSTLTVAPVAEGTVTVTASASDGTNAPVSDAFSVTVMEMDTDAEGSTVAEGFALRGVYPNPFRAETFFSFDLTAPAEVSLRVFDVRGREVWVVPSQPMAVGMQRLRVDGDAFAAGVYTYQLTAENAQGRSTASGRLVRVR